MNDPHVSDRDDEQLEGEGEGATSKEPRHAEGEESDTSTNFMDDEAAGTQGMIRGRRHRRTLLERVAMRLLATGGIIGLDVALGAILVSNNVKGWIDGLVIGLVSVILAAVLWSSRQL